MLTLDEFEATPIDELPFMIMGFFVDASHRVYRHFKDNRMAFDPERAPEIVKVIEAKLSVLSKSILERIPFDLLTAMVNRSIRTWITIEDEECEAKYPPGGFFGQSGPRVYCEVIPMEWIRLSRAILFLDTGRGSEKRPTRTISIFFMDDRKSFNMSARVMTYFIDRPYSIEEIKSNLKKIKPDERRHYLPEGRTFDDVLLSFPSLEVVTSELMPTCDEGQNFFVNHYKLNDQWEQMAFPIDPSEKRCDFCFKLESMSLCSGCLRARYCGPDCQKMAWHQHKPNCKFREVISFDDD